MKKRRSPVSSEPTFTIENIKHLKEIFDPQTKGDDQQPATQASVNDVLAEIKRAKRDVMIAVGTASLILAGVSIWL